MPALQAHQLRVAAVAKKICEGLGIDDKDIVFACLVHDMGNIIKFDLNYYPEFLQPEGLEYWQGVKDEYTKKYGSDEHVATEIIAKEIGISEQAFSYLHNIGFSKLDKVLKGGVLEQMICSYSDMRVGPHGVISIKERLIDGKKRYEGRKHAIGDGETFEIMSQALQEIENIIFNKATIRPEHINDEGIAKEVEAVAIL